MHIDDYLVDGNGHDLNDIEQSGLSSLMTDDGIGNYQDDDAFLREVMDDYHVQQDHSNPSFGKASDAEISRLQSKVNEAQHNVDVKRQDVHERQMQYNYNQNATTARHLREAKDALSHAQRELENAKYKLNHAK